MQKAASGTAIVSVFNAFGLALRIIIISVIARSFGATADLDAYFVGITLSNIISGMVSTAFTSTIVPILSELRHKEGEHNLEETTVPLIQWSCLFALALFGILALIGRPIILLMTPGFSPDQLNLAIRVFRISAAGLVFLFPLEVLRSYYLVRQQFLMNSVTLCLQPGVFLIGTLFLSKTFGTTGLVFSQVLGVSISLLILFRKFPGTTRGLFAFSHHSHLPVKRVATLILPLVVGMLAYRFLPAFDRWVASQMGEGQISLANYAQRLLETMQIFLISGLSTAIFPSLAESAALKDLVSTNRIFEKGIRLTFFIYSPVAISLFVFGDLLITTLLERGKFTNTQSLETLRLFRIYIIGMPALALCSIIGQGYYIKKDTRTVALIGVIEACVYVAIALSLREKLGILCLPWAYVGMFWFSAIVNGLTLERKYAFRLFGPAFKGFGMGFLASGLALIPWFICISTNIEMTKSLSSVLATFFFVTYFVIRWKILPTAEISWLVAVLESIKSKFRQKSTL